MTSIPRRRWARNVALTAQTVSEHVVDDPALLALQTSRKLPASLRSTFGNLLAQVGSRGSRTMEAFGYELAGDHKKARQALDTIIGRIENEGVDAQRHRLVPHVADIALSIGDQDRVEELLRNVPDAKRGAPWFATASRFALYRGEHDAAVEFASRHPPEHPSRATDDRRARYLRRLHSRVSG